MSNIELNRIVFIGAGKVADCLASVLFSNGKKIVQVFNRTEIKAKKLAKKVSAEFTTDLNNLADADIYIIAVNDTAIVEIVNKLNIKNGIIVHTAGSVKIDVLKSASFEYGVMYPVQTFIKDRYLDFYDKVPLCIEANNKAVEDKITTLAELISAHVYKLDYDKRLTLHLAAVFANNFTNYMYVAAEKLLNEQNIPFDSLKLLIEETSNIVKDSNKPEVYTGPAVRNDIVTINKHLAILANNPDLKQLYNLITQNIMNTKY